MNIGIIGSGSWARALATLVAEAGHHPRIGYQKKPLIGFPGSPNIATIAKESDLLFFAVGLARIRTLIQKSQLTPANRVVIAVRGLEPHTGIWPSAIVKAESAAHRIAVLAGPALPSEIISRRPTALVAASRFEEVQQSIQKALHSPICRLYTSFDLIGVELAGAMVRALSLALGLVDGLNQGVGVRGVVMTRGLHEATKLGIILGADESTFYGLAGMGDLVSCATLPSHKGYTAGRALATGSEIPPDFLHELHALLGIAQKNNVELPITQAITAIAMGKMQPLRAINMLMRRAATQE
jgi:glycerol-3-phosphate dehydrogenase (NAD(P)+)